MKKVLVLGGTGAMGVYLVPELLKKGYLVDVISLDERISNHPCLRYFTGDATDKSYMETVLREGYDGIVDFMIYRRQRFLEWYELLLNHTSHYIYLSSYRVYDNREHPIRETSPRLWDVSADRDLLASEDYSIYKAQGEDVLQSSRYRNWTIVRPAITYSQRRFQLVTLEMKDTVARAFQGKKVLLPKSAETVQATMTWAGDVAVMISALLFCERALKEVYTVSTAEHHTWGEIAGYYRELCGMQVEWVDEEDYIQIKGNTLDTRRQLQYDRLFDRVIDNSKILELAGMRQGDLMPLYDGLKLEISRLPRGLFDTEEYRGRRPMDEFIERHNL